MGACSSKAAFPAAPAAIRELYTVYADGSGEEARRCDHGPDRHSAAELASGDTVFQTGTGLARFTSARAGQLELALPKGQYVGPVAETDGGEWLAAYRAAGTDAYWICRFPPRAGAQPVKVAGPNAWQPVPVRVRPAPPYHPSGLGDREGANLLCLNCYISKCCALPKGSVAEVRVWALNDRRASGGAGESAGGKRRVVLRQAPSETADALRTAGSRGEDRGGGKGLVLGAQAASSGCAWAAMPVRSGRRRTLVPQVLLRSTEAGPHGQAGR